MKDSVSELRKDIAETEELVNRFLENLVKEYPDFTFHLELDENKYLGVPRRVVIKPTLIVNQQPKGKI